MARRSINVILPGRGKPRASDITDFDTSVDSRVNVNKGSGIRLAAIGTSLIQQNVAATFANKISHWSRGFIPWARFHSRGRFRHTVWFDSTFIAGWEPSGTPGATRYFAGINFGVSGQTIAQIKARLPYIEANYLDKFDAVLVDGGTNDMTTIAKEDIQADREYICSWFLARGKTVILLPILARSVSIWPAGGVERKKANWINSKSRSFCAGLRNCYFFDWNKNWIDGTNVNGEPFPNATPDGTHMAPFGGERIGRNLAAFLVTIFPHPQDRVWSQDDKYDATNPLGNVLVNQFCIGTAGINGTGSTGQVASNMAVERNAGSACTVSCSKETRADGRGENQVMAFTISGTDENTFYFRTNGNNITHTLAGKWVTASCEVETNAGDCITGVTLFAQDQNGTDGKFAYDMEPFDNGAGNVYWEPVSRVGLLHTSPFQLASNSTIARWRVEVRVKGPSSVAPVVKVGCLELRQVPSPIDGSYA